MDYYTDWNILKSSQPSDIEEDNGRTDPRWRCGNPKKRRELVSRFGKTSSLHGAAYVCSSRKSNYSFCVKAIYRILFVACLLVMTYAVASLIQESLFKQSTSINSINQDIMSGYDLEPEYFPLYPRITICRRPFYRTDFNQSYVELVEYIMLSLGMSFDPFNSQDLGMAVRLVEHHLNIVENLTEEEMQFKERLQLLEERYQDLKSTEGFNLEQFVSEHIVGCRQIFSQCVIFMKVHDCCELFEAVYTTNGLCFMVRDVTPITKAVYGSVFTDTFILDLTTPDMPDRDTEYGFRIYLSDSRMDPPIDVKGMPGENIVPGVVTTIKAQLIKTDRFALHTPWHGINSICPLWTPNSTFSTTRYTDYECQQHFIGLMMRDTCRCKPFFGYYEGSVPLKICEPFDMYHCFFVAAFVLNDSVVDVTCKKSCVVYSYKTESSYMGLGGEGNLSRVEILYNSMQYTYNEYRKATLSSLFSQIGGSLGLYLGASIITLMELVTFTVTWLWYMLAPAKVANSSKIRRR